MKHCITMAAVLCVSWSFALAGEAKKGGEAPSEIHSKMAMRVGDYVISSKFTFPDGKTQESKGTAKLTMILDGRFLKEENSSTMMGKQITGFRLFGFNTEAGQFEAIWTYTGATSMMRLIGKMTEEGKTLEFKATVDGGKDKAATFNITYHLVDEDTFRVELVSRLADGAKGPTLESTYKRKR